MPVVISVMKKNKARGGRSLNRKSVGRIPNEMDEGTTQSVSCFVFLGIRVF